MGLGPRVCLHCDLFLMLNDKHDYYCPKCGEEDYTEYLWMFDEEEQKRIHNNTKLYRFAAGIE